MSRRSPVRRSPIRRRALLLCATVGLSTLVVLAPSAPSSALPAPTPTPARVGRPTSMAALGDSITQSTGTGTLSAENPKNSWSTGSELSSVRVRLGISTDAAQNLAANGARMGNADSQVLNGRDGEALRPTTQYVTIEMGGNDLCRDSVADMTPTATYRAQLAEALAAIRSRAPEALVFVMSVPDIYNLWYIRGAPQNATYHPEPESDQADGLNGSRFYWGQSFFPCQSLLSDPSSWSADSRARREAVRQRTKDYNAAIAAECGLWLRCRTDGNRLFNFTSNRVNPPDGPLLPHSQWVFTDLDISRNTGSGTYLCPVQGVIAGGCGDHFHPSYRGQEKLADSAMASSYQFDADRIAPTVTIGQSPAVRPDGTSRGPLTVTFGGTDAAGLRGQEVRVHRPNGAVTDWSPSIGVHPAIEVSDLGQSWIEARSLDVNGNQSASKVHGVFVASSTPGAPGAPTLVPADGRDAASWSAPLDDGGLATTGHDLELAITGSAAAVTRIGTTRSSTVTVRNGRSHRVRVRAVNDLGVGEWSAPSAWEVAPFASPDAFVDRVYRDLALAPPTSAQTAAGVSTITTGGKRPADLTQDLFWGAAWAGKVGPVVRLYRAYYLRLPDASGLAYWVGRYRTGTTHLTISEFFAQSQEFKTRYGSLSNREFVRRVYQNVLERQPDAAGWDYWTAELDSGRWSRGRMMAFYSESGEYRQRSLPQIVPTMINFGLLRRVPTATEQAAAVAAQASGHSVADLIDDVLGTAEWAHHVT